MNWAEARDRAIEARHQAFMIEAAKIDTSGFSEHMQEAIRVYQEATAKMRAENETDLEYLRRKFPDMPEWARLNYMWLCAIGRIPLREDKRTKIESPGEA